MSFPPPDPRQTTVLRCPPAALHGAGADERTPRREAQGESRRLTVVVDDTVFRHDILNDDVRRVHPDLPTTPGSRGRHLAECDARAYETIRREYRGSDRPGGWGEGMYAPGLNERRQPAGFHESVFYCTVLRQHGDRRMTPRQKLCTHTRNECPPCRCTSP